MPISWFTIIAQAINFLILVWLLKRFLYKPILHAIDEREKGIAARLAEAEAKGTEAQKEREVYRLKNEAFDRDRAALVQKATDEANAERQRLLEQARKDADALRVQREQALRTEQRNLGKEIARRTRQEVFAISRKTLKDLAAANIEDQMSEVFVKRVRALSGPAKEQLAVALKSSSAPARVSSAFDLPVSRRNAIKSAFKETFAVEPEFQFETVPELVSGIELSINGQKIAWSIADYLATLEQSVDSLLHEESEATSKQDKKLKPEAATEPYANAVTDSDTRREPKRELEPVASAPKADH
jgi:F-type H+-transporting ATPase subunit b